MSKVLKQLKNWFRKKKGGATFQNKIKKRNKVKDRILILYMKSTLGDIQIIIFIDYFLKEPDCMIRKFENKL